MAISGCISLGFSEATFILRDVFPARFGDIKMTGDAQAYFKLQISREMNGPLFAIGQKACLKMQGVRHDIIRILMQFNTNLKQFKQPQLYQN